MPERGKKIELKPGEYLVPSLGITVKKDGDLVTGLPAHKIVEVGGNATKVDCPSTTGYALIIGSFPKPLAKVRCGTYSDENPTCYKAWK